MDVYSNMCRLCRSENDVKLHIFKENLFEIINIVLPTKVSEYDDLPNHICVDCGSKLNIISEFRDTVRNADFQYQSLIASKFSDSNVYESKILLSSEDVVKGLLQLKDLTVKKMDEEITNTTLTQKKTSVVHNKRIKASYDLLSKLSKSGVIVKKIRPSTLEGQIFSDTYVYLPVNNAHNHDEKEGPVIINEPDTDSDSEDLYSDTDDNFEPEMCTKESATKSQKQINKKVSNSDKQKMASKSDIPTVEVKTTLTYVCMACQNRFLSYNELKTHTQTNEVCKNVKLTCEICGKVVKDRKAMYQHALTHKEKQKFICEECGKTYTNIFNMENHKAIMHGDKEELTGSVYKCKVCNETFVKRKDLFLHVNKHTKEQVHLCDTCGKCFSTEDNLRSHLRTHSDIRPYACDNCDKQFRTRLALVQHSHRHTGIKPFVCDVCGKTFAKKYSLTNHVRLHSGEVIVYQCHICLEQFPSNGKLKTHIKFHPA